MEMALEPKPACRTSFVAGTGRLRPLQPWVGPAATEGYTSEGYPLGKRLHKNGTLLWQDPPFFGGKLGKLTFFLFRLGHV